MREALASALSARDAFEGATVLDLFSGTGALSFEALSRGATSALAVDRNPNALRALERSARELGVEPDVRAIRLDLLGNATDVVRKLPENPERFTLVFADAPYAEVHFIPRILEELVAQNRLAPSAWVVVERPSKHAWVWPNGLAPDADYRYGHTGISLGIYDPEKGTS